MALLCHIWDWIILSIYIYKLWQLHKDINHGENNADNQLLKIKLMLFKIVLLTRIYELAAIMVTSIFIMKPGIFIQNDKYIILLRIMKQFKCVIVCCCC